VFYSEKIHLFSKFKRIFLKTLGRAQGRGGGGDLQESSFCHPSADEDGQNPNIWGMIS